MSGNKFLFSFMFCCGIEYNHVFGCGNFCDMFFMIFGFVIRVGVSNSVLFLWIDQRIIVVAIFSLFSTS